MTFKKNKNVSSNIITSFCISAYFSAKVMLQIEGKHPDFTNQLYMQAQADHTKNPVFEKSY